LDRGITRRATFFANQGIIWLDNGVDKASGKPARLARDTEDAFVKSPMA
jgi:hypothetical protein